MLEAGAKVPDVGAGDQDGNDVRLRGFAGRTLVVAISSKADKGHAAAVLEAVRSL